MWRCCVYTAWTLACDPQKTALDVVLSARPAWSTLVALNVGKYTLTRQIWKGRLGTLTRLALHCAHPERVFLEPNLGIRASSDIRPVRT